MTPSNAQVIAEPDRDASGARTPTSEGKPMTPNDEQNQPAGHTGGHTPGPWTRADGRATGFKTTSGGESILAVARPSDDFFILKIAEMDSNVPLREREANARLIAAAPDLLAALKAVLSQHENPVRDGKSKERWDAARAAIRLSQQGAE